MKEEKKYSGSKTRNYFTAYLLASIQGRRLRYLEKQQKILFAEENLAVSYTHLTLPTTPYV